MKLKKKFLGLIMGLCAILTFSAATSAMENKTKKGKEIPIEFVVMERAITKDRIDTYGKIKSILEQFNLFDEDVKDYVMLYICSEKMQEPIQIFRKILNYIYGKRTYDLKFEEEVGERAFKVLKDKNKISADLFEKAKDDIKSYLDKKVKGIAESLEKVKKEYDELIEGEKHSKIPKSEYEFSLKDMKEAMENFKNLLEKIQMLSYDQFKD